MRRLCVLILALACPALGGDRAVALSLGGPPVPFDGQVDSPSTVRLRQALSDALSASGWTVQTVKPTALMTPEKQAIAACAAAHADWAIGGDMVLLHSYDEKTHTHHWFGDTGLAVYSARDAKTIYRIGGPPQSSLLEEDLDIQGESAVAKVSVIARDIVPLVQALNSAAAAAPRPVSITLTGVPGDGSAVVKDLEKLFGKARVEDSVVGRGTAKVTIRGPVEPGDLAEKIDGKPIAGRKASVKEVGGSEVTVELAR